MAGRLHRPLAGAQGPTISPGVHPRKRPPRATTRMDGPGKARRTVRRAWARYRWQAGGADKGDALIVAVHGGRGAALCTESEGEGADGP
jgi:hypothetical protein